MNLLKTTFFIHILICAALLSPVNHTRAQVNIYPFVENGKIGYKDTIGSVIIDPQFDYVEEFKDGYNWTVVGIGDYELLNNRFDRRELKFKGKFGLINHIGNIIFHPEFTLILNYYPEYAVVGNGSGYLHFENFPEDINYTFEGDLGVVGIQGDTILPIQFKTVQPLITGDRIFWFTRKNGDKLLFLENRQLFPPPEIESIEDFMEGLAKFKTSSGYGFIDTGGHIVISPQFEKAGNFQGDKALVKKQSDYFYINKSGQILDSLEIRFDEIAPFSEGLARIRILDEYGYIDTDSNVFIQPGFEESGSFFNEITYVSTTDSFGYIHIDRKKDFVLKYDRDPIRTGNVINDQAAELRLLKSYPCECSDSSVINISFDSLNLENFITLQLEALRWAPYLYYRYPQMLPKVCAGEGTLTGRYDFNFNFLKKGSSPWELFKKEVLFTILKNKHLTTLTWAWLEPLYKKVYQSMPEKHQEVYIGMLTYLEDYFQNFSSVEVRHFLTSQPDKFAYQHWDGSTSPYRKVSALLERLIFIHEVLDVREINEWINTIKNEVVAW